MTNTDDPPVVQGSIPGQTAPKGPAFHYQVLQGLFVSIDPGEYFTFTATLDGGAPLPAWLSFDPASQTFSGAPGDTDTGVYKIRLSAADSGTPPHSVSLIFSLTVPNLPPSGTDRVLTIDEDEPHTFNPADFGFSDPNDNPPNVFSKVTISSPPAAGTLSIDGIPVTAGDSVALFPDSRMVWTPHESNRSWRAVASSADGVKLAAIDHGASGGLIYTSADSGQTWTPRESSRYWNALASSADGATLAAANFGGRLYVSRDSGLTWTPGGVDREWTGIAASADGTRITAVSRDGMVAVSRDSGLTWTTSGAPSGLYCLACSADGLKLIAGTSGANRGPLQLSQDGGLTWTAREGDRQWYSVASSADGTRLIAAALYENLYISHDSGLTWIARGGSEQWECVASTADGMRLAAAGDRIHTSTDGGLTWSAREQARNWRSIASSADGLKLIAGVYSGKLYTSVAEVPQLIFKPAANAFGSNFASIGFQVQDNGSGAATMDPTPNVIRLDVVSVNDAPGILPLNEAFATENQAFAHTLTNSYFSDPDEGSVLTFSVMQEDGSPLPAWLTLDAAQRRLSGTPRTADLGILRLKATVTDNGTPPLSGSAPLVVNVSNVDDPPSGADGSKIIAEDTPYAFKTTDFGFSDAADAPPNRIARVKIATLPALGSLSAGGASLAEGDFVNVGNSKAWAAREISRKWYSIASSADGYKLIAAVNNGRLYISSDAGLTWSPRENNRDWYHVASSADGTRLAAVVSGGNVYVSADAGATWTLRAAYQSWRAIASSADGRVLAAIAQGVRISVSTDFGLTWTARDTTRSWYSITCSADGSKMAAVDRGGLIYTSTDSGATWTPRATAQTWRCITSSADGQRLAAIVESGRIHTSADGGLTWEARETRRNWYAITSSADGLRLAAVVQNGRIYLSEDAGLTWQGSDSSRAWRTLACSADGLKIAAVVPDGQIYTLLPPSPQTLVYTPGPNGIGSPYDSFTFQVEDDGLPGPNLDPTAKTFRFSVLPVNDPPTLDAVPDPLPLPLSGNPGAITIPLSGISAGPGESQDLTISAVSSNPAVIPHPVVNYHSPDATGSLTYTPAASSGYAVITITVRDNGGVAEDGADTLTRTFVVRHTTPFLFWAMDHGLPADPGAAGGANLIRFASGLEADAPAGRGLRVEDGAIIERGLPVLSWTGPLENKEFKALFGRRKGAGLHFTPQFSSDLQVWESAAGSPQVLADDGLIEACEIPFPPALSNGAKPRFFRLAVDDPP